MSLADKLQLSKEELIYLKRDLCGRRPGGGSSLLQVTVRRGSVAARRRTEPDLGQVAQRLCNLTSGGFISQSVESGGPWAGICIWP